MKYHIYYMNQDPDRWQQHQQQHDEQQEKKQQRPFQFLAERPDDDAIEIVSLDVDDDDVSAISPPSSSSSAHIGDDDIINNKNNNHNQGNPMMMKQKKRNKVVSFRLSEAEYARYLSVAKICHKNGLTKSPDIVAFIRLSMECLWKYINS